MHAHPDRKENALKKSFNGNQFLSLVVVILVAMVIGGCGGGGGGGASGGGGGTALPSKTFDVTIDVTSTLSAFPTSTAVAYGEFPDAAHPVNYPLDPSQWTSVERVDATHLRIRAKAAPGRHTFNVLFGAAPGTWLDRINGVVASIGNVAVDFVDNNFGNGSRSLVFTINDSGGPVGTVITPPSGGGVTSVAGALALTMGFQWIGSPRDSSTPVLYGEIPTAQDPRWPGSDSSSRYTVQRLDNGQRFKFGTTAVPGRHETNFLVGPLSGNLFGDLLVRLTQGIATVGGVVPQLVSNELGGFNFAWWFTTTGEVAPAPGLLTVFGDSVDATGLIRVKLYASTIAGAIGYQFLIATGQDTVGQTINTTSPVAEVLLPASQPVRVKVVASTTNPSTVAPVRVVAFPGIPVTIVARWDADPGVVTMLGGLPINGVFNAAGIPVAGSGLTRTFVTQVPVGQFSCQLTSSASRSLIQATVNGTTIQAGTTGACSFSVLHSTAIRAP